MKLGAGIFHPTRWARAALHVPARAAMRVPLARRALLALLGVPLDPFGSAFRENPYPFYDRMRRRDPVHFARVGCWLVTTYAEAMSVLREPRFGHPDHRQAMLMQPHATALERLWSDLFIVMNPPDHTRVRRAVAEPLAPAALEALRPRVQALTDRLLDRVEPHGRMDVIADLAHPLAVGTIADVLGVPAEDLGRLGPQLHSVVGLVFELAPSRARIAHASAAVEELRRYFEALLAGKRRTPQADVLSALLDAERRDQLTGGEVLATSILLAIAGYETTIALIGNGLLALLRNPSELSRLRDDGELIRGAVEELVRYDAPVQSFGRLALDDVRLGTKLVRRGQQVYVLTGAANRDPARFPDPDRLDITRPDRAHLGFGAGIHACPGQHLARIETQIAIATLVRRFSRMELLTQSPPWHDSPHRRGLRSLPIAF